MKQNAWKVICRRVWFWTILWNFTLKCSLNNVMCAQNEPVTYLWISHETWRYVSHGSNDGWYFNFWKQKERFVLLISHFFGEKFWKISDFFLMREMISQERWIHSLIILFKKQAFLPLRRSLNFSIKNHQGNFFCRKSYVLWEKGAIVCHIRF